MWQTLFAQVGDLDPLQACLQQTRRDCAVPTHQSRALARSHHLSCGRAHFKTDRGDGIPVPKSHHTVIRHMKKMSADLLLPAFPHSSQTIFCSMCLDGWTDPTGRHMYGFIYRGEDHMSPVVLGIRHIPGTQDFCKKAMTTGRRLIGVSKISKVNRMSVVPHLVHFRCLCHTLNLAPEDTIQASRAMWVHNPTFKPRSYSRTRWGSIIPHLEDIIKASSKYHSRSAR